MSSEEYGIRGPQGRLHLPQWSKGCYYGRASACGLCKTRLLWAILKLRLRIRRDGGGR